MSINLQIKDLCVAARKLLAKNKFILSLKLRLLLN